MKNIHVLPTDKPSRFCIKVTDGFQGYDFHLYNERKRNTWYRPQHIYITSDEEIKEGDAYITKHGEICKSHNGSKIILFKTDKKIILTTDQDLIKDGVQAIDDEFLEWFVKNPSCESVDLDTFSMGDKVLYNVVFPQEEPKPIHEQIIEHCGGEEKFKEIAGLKPKQETLEEAAEKTNDYYNFIKGAKWQAERMYSEEDMEKAFYEGLRKAYSSKKHSTCWKEWFEQFKKQK